MIYDERGILSSFLRFEGYGELAVLDACERGINVVFLSMLVLALPPTLLEHLWLNYKPVGWLYVIVPALFVPVALGLFPRKQISRFFLAMIAMTLLGLSINSLYSWAPQPGLYLMIPPVIFMFVVGGTRLLAVVTVLQIVLVGGSSLAFRPDLNGSSTLGIVISLALWVSIAIACAMMVHQILISSRLRASELDTLAEQLLENEKILRENNQSLQHIFRVSLGEIDECANEISTSTSDSERQVAIAALREHVGDLRERVLPSTP